MLAAHGEGAPLCSDGRVSMHPMAGYRLWPVFASVHLQKAGMPCHQPNYCLVIHKWLAGLTRARQAISLCRAACQEAGRLHVQGSDSLT